MLKRIFALASVSALTGLVSAVAAAGCSSDEPAAKSPLEAGSPNQNGEGGANNGPTDGGGGGDDEPACMEQDAIDETKFPYATAKKQANACTNKELEDLAQFFIEKAQNTEDISIGDWSKVVSEGCAKCVFSDGTGAEWSPILVKGDKLDNVNRGGCIEIASGKRSCGQAYQRVAECRLAACVDTCKTAEGFTECLQDVEGIFTGPCKSAYDTMQKECGQDLPNYEAACRGTNFTFEGPIRVQCINGGANTQGD